MFTVTVNFERAASSLTSSGVSQNPNCRAGSGLLAKQDHSQNRSVGKPIRRQSNIIIPLTVSPATGTTLKPRFNYSIHEVKCNLGKTKSVQWFHQCDVGGSREVCRGTAMYLAQFALLHCFLRFPPSLPHFKYVFIRYTGCCVDRYLVVGCGTVVMVTSLPLRRLLPSSVATFTAPTLQYYYQEIYS